MFMTTRRPIALVHRLGWLLLAVMGCGAPNDDQAHDDGGQTGSASCGTSPRCICDSAAGADVVRGVVSFTQATDTTTTQASIEVLDVLGTSDLSVGDILTGPYQVGFPCGLGNLPPIPDGAEVMVAIPSNNGGLPPNMYVVAWDVVLQLTPELSLPATEAAILTDSTACGVEFPDKEVECKDNF